MHSLKDIAPTIDSALELSIHEMGYACLLHIQAHYRNASPRPQLLHAANFEMEMVRIYEPRLGDGVGSPSQKLHRLRILVAAGLAWLVTNGLASHCFENNYTYLLLTPRGEDVDAKEVFERFVLEAHLKPDSLHPSIRDRAWPLYARGNFDLAVLESFKQIEVRVRERGNFTAEDFGVDMVRRAFNATGPLRDTSLPRAEQDAVMNLFAGAIGAFKNPNSHRNLELDDATKAAELLMFASHLMRMLD